MGYHRPRTPRLGEKLRQIRKTIDGGMTQNELVRRLGLEEDFDQERISKYERGVLEPPVYVLIAYSDLARVSLDVLLRSEYDLPPELPAKGADSAPAGKAAVVRKKPKKGK